jgi:hypothetical protein
MELRRKRSPSAPKSWSRHGDRDTVPLPTSRTAIPLSFFFRGSGAHGWGTRCVGLRGVRRRKNTALDSYGLVGCFCFGISFKHGHWSLLTEVGFCQRLFVALIKLLGVPETDEEMGPGDGAQDMHWTRDAFPSSLSIAGSRISLFHLQTQTPPSIPSFSSFPLPCR